MKIKATFEKREFQVGLSSEVPIFYSGPEQKYALADWASLQDALHVRFSHEKTLVELDITTAELISVRNPERLRCHTLIAQLPDSAIKEAAEELTNIRDHYVDIADQFAALPPPQAPQLVAARVLEDE